jgi:hypothetical protein
MSNQFVAAVVEMDVERDRKSCIALDQKVAGANRELAQWLMDHPRYSGTVVAEWLGCGKTRINDLRKWAIGGFDSAPFGQKNKPDNRDRGRGHAPLKSNEDFQDEESSDEDPKGFVLAVIRNAAEKVNIAVRNLSPDFTNDDRAEITEAIDALVRKWESVKRKLRTRT